MDQVRKASRMDLNKTLIYGVSYLLALLWLLPLLWMIITAFKTEGSVVTVLSELIKPPFSLSSFVKVNRTAMMGQWTINSFLVAIIQTSSTIVFSSLAAYAISQIKFKGKTLVFAVIMAGLMVPVESTIVPLFQMLVDFGWINTYKALIFPGIAMPLGVFVLKQFYDGIPRELVEAGRIDGLNVFGTWWHIFVPLSKTATASIGIFIFIQSWNNFLWPLLAASESKMMTLPVAIPTFQSSFTTDFTVPMAANLLASLPALLVFILLQKNIVKGIAMTGIKG